MRSAAFKFFLQIQIKDIDIHYINKVVTNKVKHHVTFCIQVCSDTLSQMAPGGDKHRPEEQAGR